MYRPFPCAPARLERTGTEPDYRSERGEEDSIVRNNPTITNPATIPDITIVIAIPSLKPLACAFALS